MPFAVGAFVRFVFLVAAGSSGRGMPWHMVRPRSLSLTSQSGRRVMQVARRRAARAVVDVSKRAGVRRRAVLGMRMRECIPVRERVPLPVSFMPTRKARRAGLQLPRRLPRGGWSLAGQAWRRSRSHCRPARTGRVVRSRLWRRPAVDDSWGVMRNGCNRSRRSRGGRRRRRNGRRGGNNSRARGAVPRGRGRPVVRLRGVRRSSHDDILRWGRAEARARADRRQVHRTRVEEQRDRAHAEKQRDRRRRHSSDNREPSGAFVGRHRPLLPFLDGPAPAFARDTRNRFEQQPGFGADVRCFRSNH